VGLTLTAAFALRAGVLLWSTLVAETLWDVNPGWIFGLFVYAHFIVLEWLPLLFVVMTLRGVRKQIPSSDPSRVVLLVKAGDSIKEQVRAMPRV